jgi:cephalosporin-C deacetylase
MTTTVRRAPDTHQTSVHRPPDFDDFWQQTMAEAAAIPLNPSIERVPMRSTPDVDVFEIHYDSLDGVRIAGWYCVPTERHIPPPYPALLIVPGYISEPTLPKSWAKQGYAAVGVAPRGKLRSNNRFNPGYPGLLVNNIVDRQTYSYRGFYVDACRAVDFVLTRPEVDHTRIGVHGSSQGGALTVTTAALRNDVITCGAAGAPYLAGFMDAIGYTQSYPYEEMNEYLRQYPDREAAMRQTVAYYDGINFAPRIRCPMLIYVGLGDDVCPPETGFDLEAAMTCPTELHAYPRCAHDAGNYWEAANVEAFLAGHLHPAGYRPPVVDAHEAIIESEQHEGAE